MFISEDTLLRGSWYALEQAGRLLHSAVTLFDGGDPSTAVVLAMFGREELGRSQILRDLAAKVKAGQKLTAIQISKSREDYIEKQKAAALSTTLRVSPNTQLSAAVQTRVRAGFHSEAGCTASAEIEEATKAKPEEGPEESSRCACAGTVRRPRRFRHIMDSSSEPERAECQGSYGRRHE